MKYTASNLKLDKQILMSSINETYRQLGVFFSSISSKTEIVNEAKPEDLGLSSESAMFDISKELTDFLVNYRTYNKNQIIHSVLAVSIYSFLETSLFEYCRLLALYANGIEEFGKTKGKGIEKVKCYFKNNYQTNISESVYWQQIKNLSVIRNYIVHSNSSLMHDYSKPLSKQKDYRFFNQMKNEIEVSSTGVFFIKRTEYLLELFEQAQKFIIEITSIKVKV